MSEEHESCPGFDTCTVENKDNYYCHDFCPYIEGSEEDYEEGFDWDDCPFGSPCMPQLGTEECDFICVLSKSCNEIYNSMPDCVALLDLWPSWWPNCSEFHMGKCYLNFYGNKKLRAFVQRLKCRLNIIPKRPETSSSYCAGGRPTAILVLVLQGADTWRPPF